LAPVKQVGGWDERKAATRLQAVLKRARVAAAEQLVHWNGQDIDHRPLQDQNFGGMAGDHGATIKA
jgi:hypothetical protein